MKILYFFLSRYVLYPIFPVIIFLLLCIFSCEKDENSIIGFEFQTVDVIYFPKKNISVKFNIIPNGNYEPLVLKWISPDSLKEDGPNRIELSKNLLLDFEIADTKGISQRFTHELLADSYDSLKYDYRNLIGTYDCAVSYSYNGTLKYSCDTLTVVKKGEFIMLNIQGNGMRYLNRYNNDSTITFYGYHSGASFSNDSIHYTVSGPLGFYYTNVYEGIRIEKHY